MADWDEADHFRIPLVDGSFGLGQIVRRLDTGPLIILTLRKTPRTDAPLLSIGAAEIIALLRTTETELMSGLWPVVGFEALPENRAGLTQDRAAPEVFDPEMVEAFLNACHGLIEWDSFPGGIFDRMLVPGFKRRPSVQT